MKAHNLTLFILAFVFNLSMLIALLLMAVDSASFARAFYAKQYRELNTAAEIGITESDLDLATEQLLDYIQDKTEQLDLRVTLQNIDGKPQELMFNQRELDHMVDVQALYLTAMTVRNVLLGLAAAALLFLLFLARVSKNLQVCKSIRQGMGSALVLFLLLIGAIAAYAVVDFNGFWTRFHLLFFSNDLWILDPRTDRLIMMVPSEFFFALVSKILLSAVAALLAYSGLAFAITWYCEKKKKNSSQT